MAVSLSVIVAKDGAGATIVGGLQAQDKSGAGTGPFTLGQVLIDGAAGTNMMTITAAGAAKVDGSAVTQPVSLTSTTITGTVAVTQSGTWTVQPGNTANTTAWLAKIGDGTNTAAIKAASTAPLATDPALVVAISPNSANTNGQKTMANGAPVTLPSDQSTLAVANDTSAIMNGASGVVLTPKFATIAASTSGNNTLVAAVTSKKIRVIALWLTSSGTVNAKFQSGASGTDLTGLGYEVANTGLVLPFNPVGWFESASGVLLNLNLSGAIAVGGSLIYVEV